MLNQYYIKTENRINYAKKFPNSGVKCSVCQVIFSIHQIEHHMSLHIAPQYMAPNTKPNEIKKMSRPKIFFSQKENDFMSSAIKSISKEQLPKYQVIRNFKSIPSHIQNIHIQTSATPSFIGTQINNFDQTQAETALNVNNIEKDELPRQNIQQNLLLTQQSLRIQKNHIQVYKTEKPQRPQTSLLSTGNSWTQPTKVKQKQPFHQKSNDQSVYQGYQITIQKQNDHKGYLPILETLPEQKFQVNLQKYKPPEVRNQSICTKTGEIKKQMKKSSSFQFLAQIFGCKQSSTETKRGQIMVNMDKTETGSGFYRTQSQQNFNKEKNHKCNDCQGFYCATCQSTIPPQYRPVNVFSRDQKTTDYYRNIVYKHGSCGKVKQLGEQKDCEDCAE